MSSARADSLIGHTLSGKYVIREFIAEEQLGKVYIASVLPENTLVNLKVLHPHLYDNPEVFARFGREMLATATINHPNTVKMIDFGDHRGVFHFLVLEQLNVHSLRDELDQNGPLPAERVAHIAAQVASALSAAHAENIIHRNLSPDSILLVDDAEGDYVKVRDFGLSRLQDPEHADDVTAVGTRVGTAGYMAPEYIGEARIDPRGDLYGLGVVMFELLTGKPPFEGPAGLLLDKHISEEPPAPSSMLRGVPEWMDALVLHLLAKKPEQRPRDGAEVVRRLQEATGQELAPPKRTGVSRSRSRVPDEEEGGGKGAMVGIGLGIILLGALAVGGLFALVIIVVMMS